MVIEKPEILMESRAQSSVMSLPAIVVISIFVVAVTSLHIWMHHNTHGIFNSTQMILAFFLAVNLLISLWEITLFVRQDQIQEEYRALRETYRGKETEAANAVFLRPIPLHRIFLFREWAPIWSTYSLFDNGFADRRAFGYNIDVGNGFTTLIPTTLFTFGMTFHFFSARVLGIIGVIIFWQMFYGTCVYFFQYFNNGRHKGHTFRDVFLVVGVSNGLWWIFPLFGLYTSTRLILDGSYTIFLG